MSQLECVPREQLEKYMLGDLPDDDWQAVSAHLEICERCEETVSQLDRAEDTLLTALRGPVAENPEPTVYRLAARRAKSLNLSSIGVATTDKTSSAKCLRDYELIEPIARGGMGTVYRALHRRLQRQVAVKVLPYRCLANPHAVVRFQREMQAVGQLRHPAIVQATDGGEVDGVHFLVMELIDGLDLSSLVRVIGALSCADACELARRTALGLAHAHEQGVIHRDVKPSNVMLTAEGEVKILDLGLARIVGEQRVCDELTTVGQLMGTVDYMAPEQFEDSHQADERCDIYGLGATLFKLLSGSAPYCGSRPDSPLVKLKRIAGEPPPPLSTKRKELPADLCHFVDRMLSRRPEDRPASMTEVAAALEPWCAGNKLGDLARNGLAKHVAARRQQQQDALDSVGNVHVIPPSVPPEKPQAMIDSRASKSRSGRFSTALVGLLLVGLLAALAIVITIQTSGGQLVIETAVPDVEIRLVRAGQSFKTLTLTQQPNTLRLGVGEYEVQLIGATDGLQVENNKFTLTRGQTVVARVVHTPLVALAPTVAVPSTPPTSQLPEPRFDGKTTAEWIAILFEDRSPERVIAAFDALQKLGLDQELRADAIKAIFHAARFHEKPPLRTGTGSKSATSPPTRSVWPTAVQTLRSFDAAAVVAHSTMLLEDSEYRPKRFVSYVLRTDSARYRSHLTVPLRNQLRHFAEQGSAEERDEAMNALARLLGETDPQFVELCRSWLSSDDFGRLQAARWLVAAKQSPAEVVAVLRQMIKSGAPDLRSEAVAVLGDLGSDAKPAVPDLIAIVEMASQTQANPRDSQSVLTASRFEIAANQAIEALGKIGDLSAAPVLIREWRRRVAMIDAARNARSNFDLQRRPMTDTRAVTEAIQALTGLVYHSSSSDWTRDDARLIQACSRFLTSGVGPEHSAARQKSASEIDQLLLVSTDSEVEQAITGAVSRARSNEPYTERLGELVTLLRPKLAPRSEYRALLAVFSASEFSDSKLFESIRSLTFAGGLRGPVRSIQQLLLKRVAESPEAKSQVFVALAEAIESSRTLDLIYNVDTLVALGVPDSECSQRIVTALEKARDPELPWKNEAVDRGIKHLRGEAADSKPSTRSRHAPP